MKFTTLTSTILVAVLFCSSPTSPDLAAMGGQNANDKEMKHLQDKLAAEKNKREAAEKRAKGAEEQAQTWKIYCLLSLGISLVLIVVGLACGAVLPREKSAEHVFKASISCLFIVVAAVIVGGIGGSVWEIPGAAGGSGATGIAGLLIMLSRRGAGGSA